MPGAGHMSSHCPGAPSLGASGIGVAGFVLSLLGVSLIGLILSWVGLAQANREGRPTGLCVAGIIIGILGMILGVVVFIAINATPSSTYPY